MKPSELLKQWHYGTLSRDGYAQILRDKFYELEDWAEMLDESDVKEIRIETRGITITSRWSGARFYCRFDDPRTPPVVALAFGSYERLEMQTLREIWVDSATFIDVGANVGWYAVQAAVVNPRLRVIAIEPANVTVTALHRNIELNDVKVEVEHRGLGDASGTATLTVSASRTDAASLKPSREYPYQMHESIEMTTLDELCSSLGIVPDLIKIDVEGAELPVLSRGVEVLTEARPVVMAEMLRLHSASFGYHPNEIIELMSGLGYRCFASAGTYWRPFENMSDSTIETNFLFLHRERHKSIMSSWSDSSGNLVPPRMEV